MLIIFFQANIYMTGMLGMLVKAQGKRTGLNGWRGKLEGHRYFKKKASTEKLDDFRMWPSASRRTEEWIKRRRRRTRTRTNKTRTRQKSVGLHFVPPNILLKRSLESKIIYGFCVRNKYKSETLLFCLTNHFNVKNPIVLIISTIL